MFVTYFFTIQILEFDSITVQMKAMGGKDLAKDSIGRLSGEFMIRYINVFYLIYVFFFASLSRFFYRKKGYYFSEYIVIGFYSVGHYIFLALFLILLSYLDGRFFLYGRVLVLVHSIWLLTCLDKNGHIVSKLSKSILVVIISYLLFVIVSQLITLMILS